MLNVFITVDTEVWPNDLAGGPGEESFAAAFRRDILGRTKAGDYGLPLQLKIMNDHGIQASFFVESLFASGMGAGALGDITGMVEAAGHEVQMHLHPEWAQAVPELQSLYNGGNNLQDYNKDQQYQMLKTGLDNLAAAGVPGPRAFRAGNYGAGFSTLKVLNSLGIEFDTSYNYCYLASDCDLQTSEPLLQPSMLEGVLEFPVSFFQDWPGHYRHTQLTACSFAELSAMLDQACDRGWSSFVIVSHGFELLNPARSAPDGVVRRRFEKLCAFIAANSDRMKVGMFKNLDVTAIGAGAEQELLTSNMLRTASRYAIQILRRLPRRPTLT
ncbi:MAG: polysaccharide deacetylase [Gammaproteobacteria bacterium]|jgi:hypothetical protein|nr:polysaccharide deacetylase [Gammaproteobacteria bacterium]MDP6617345.1 polysaccharide deacetylase [Gammaproteobacteria bacterium]MDP6694934.1 polysaccharide deacetylase [Gammaproteobacteria bacterium]